MAITSGSNRAASLKTYSKCVNITTTEKPAKRKASVDEETVVELPPEKKFKKSSIQSYFKPVVTSSSPAPNRSNALVSSDSIRQPSSPSSSPPLESSSPPIVSERPIQKPKRRLSTKPKSFQIARMSDTSELCKCLGDILCLEHSGASKYIDDLPKMQDLAQLAGRPRNAMAPSMSMVSNPKGAHPREQTQLLLNPGGTVFICKICSVRYNKASKEDVQVHQRKHTEFVTLGSNGVNFDAVTIGVGAYWSSISPDAPVRTIKVNIHSPAAVQSFAGRVLFRVNEELGYGDGSHVAIDHKNDVIIALIQGQPVACIVVEGPTFAIPFWRRDIHMPGRKIGNDQVSSINDIHEVPMCVDRLWVHKDFRRGRLALSILNAARNQFGCARYQVCFSRPTQLGYEFACSYFKGVFNHRFPNQDIKMLMHLDDYIDGIEKTRLLRRLRLI
ncbi:uncharacterized protein RAG0_14891 [Rhynchosporium agropyri]|uniref:N-acetyltransferase ESCO acetyl-transferase domain-containing protein n=1 Tax=Rhynchosporium agropyri TaxID=914238 RepID=A0A1E1LIQ7_9HELO|nr:uncharacterized protein RAG0_14891 [Rhynchosporium agropyri]